MLQVIRDKVVNLIEIALLGACLVVCAFRERLPDFRLCFADGEELRHVGWRTDLVLQPAEEEDRYIRY